MRTDVDPAHCAGLQLPCVHPMRGEAVPKSQLIQPGELERAVEALTRQIGLRQPVLVLLDADDDCPKDLAEKLKARCHAKHADLTISIVIAKREYEAWFLAAARSLAGQRGLAEQLDPPLDPESVQGAKEWLTVRMRPDQSYSPTRHQSAYSDLMDLSEARRARSFRKLEKELGRLLGWERGEGKARVKRPKGAYGKRFGFMSM